MKLNPADKGKIFTKYSLVVFAAVVVVGLLLYFMGDFVYSQIRPTTPTITYPVPHITVSKNPPTFEGSLPLNATIKIIVDGKEVAARNSEGQITWSYTPAQQMEVGDHAIAVYAVSPEGLKSRQSDEIAFTVPVRPAIESFYDKEKYAYGRMPRFAGLAEPETEVDLYIDDAFVSSTISKEDGKWAFPSVPASGSGTHSAYVIAVKTLGEFHNTSEVLHFIISPSPSTLR